MQRTIKSPQAAAFLWADLATFTEPPESPAYIVGESLGVAGEALTTENVGHVVGDYLEVTGVGADGKRQVIKRFPLGAKVGNRHARRKALARSRQRA